MKRERKRGTFLLFLFFVISILFSSCSVPPSEYEYEFVNRSSYSITITLNQKFTLIEDEDPPNYYLETSLYPNTSKILYVESGSVDFSWTASSVGDNRYIYIEADGSKITFRERAIQ